MVGPGDVKSTPPFGLVLQQFLCNSAGSSGLVRLVLTRLGSRRGVPGQVQPIQEACYINITASPVTSFAIVAMTTPNQPGRLASDSNTSKKLASAS